MPVSEIVRDVEVYVRGLFEKKLGQDILYHTISHTIEVVDAVEIIGKAERITEDDLEILFIAAWFHDTGHFHCCNGHEEQSTIYAKEYLDKLSYPVEKIEKILQCIRATKIPQHPSNKLEEIICDADMCHLGEVNIKERGELLRQELELRGIKILSDYEWMTHSINFFDQHHYFTEFARKKYGEQKKKNLNKMKEHYNSLVKHDK